MEASVSSPASSRYMSREAPPRGPLPVVQAGGGPVRQPKDHEASPTDVPGLGIHDCQGEGGGDGRIHGVSTGLEDLQPHG